MIDFPNQLRREVLLDTNLLLLVLVGGFDRKLIGTGRLDSYSIEDYERLSDWMSHAKVLITTPGILTETSNLSAQMIPSRLHGIFFAGFVRLIKLLDERHEPAVKVSQMEVFSRFGLTDSTIAAVATAQTIVLTDDRRLAGYLQKLGVKSLNFNHYRSI